MTNQNQSCEPTHKEVMDDYYSDPINVWISSLIDYNYDGDYCEVAWNSFKEEFWDMDEEAFVSSIPGTVGPEERQELIDAFRSADGQDDMEKFNDLMDKKRIYYNETWKAN